MPQQCVPRYPITLDGETVSIGTAGELVVALDVLQGHHDREVLEQLAPHLAEIVATPQGLLGTLRSLAPADQLFLIDALGPSLCAMVGSASHLRDILAFLSEPEVEDRLLQTLGSAGLRRLVQTAEELAEVLEWVYGFTDVQLLDLIGTEHLRRMMAGGRDLSLVLHGLDADSQLGLIERLGWGWVQGLVRSGADLAYLLRALPAALGKELLGHFSRADLLQLIGNERDWAFLYQRLEAEEAAFLCDLLGVEHA